MPRKNPVPERERLICARLRAFRESTKLTRAAFAREIGVEPLLLASYELGRAPVRFDLAWRIKQKFHLSLVWLFKEQGNMLGNYAISPQCVPDPSMLFSKAFEFYLSQALIDARAVQHASGIDEVRIATASKGSSLSGAELDLIFKKTKDELPQRCWDTYRMALAGWSQDVAAVLNRSLLTDAETSPKVTGEVKPQLPSLLERLKKATAETGKKSELAKFLSRATGESVPLASVSRWLSGEREPGGEVALQMDAWATAQGYPRGK